MSNGMLIFVLCCALPLILQTRGLEYLLKEKTELNADHDEASDVDAEARESARQGRQVLSMPGAGVGAEDACPFASPEYHVPHDVVRRCRDSDSVLKATKDLQQRLKRGHGLSPKKFKKYLAENSHFQAHANCKRRKPVTCDKDEPYRRLDGACNNLKFPTRGQANTALERLLPANYEDGVYAPRKSVRGTTLPSARLLSRTLYTDSTSEDTELTQAFMLFGQYLSHEFSLTLPARSSKGVINCCTRDGSNVLPPKQLHPACFPIFIPDGDEFYTKHKQRCMNFVRSTITTAEDCSMGPAEQLNVVTSYLDASPLYGNDRAKSDSLRSFFGGELLVSVEKGRAVLPIGASNSSCDARNPHESCYVSGDPRGNQHPQLTAFHIMLMREHNAIAQGLESLNPHWDDEKLFQEARRLLIAIIQHITYYEWLPLLIEPEYLEEHHIVHTGPGFSKDYSVDVNAATLNVFTAGAYRYLHSTIQSHPGLVSENRHEYDRMYLKDTFNRPGLVAEREDNYDALLRGMATNPMMQTDNHFSHVVTRFLFAGTRPYGKDLISLDIQRGRDHGLDSYVEYRSLCGFSPVTSFEDLDGIMSRERISLLRKLYSDVRDIDFFVGAIAENHVDGSILGPTIQCIVGEQFLRWRVGDRFFFEAQSSPHPFSDEQLAEIRMSSFARLLCDNSDDVQTMQSQAFRLISARNPIVSCEGTEIPRIDLRPWQE